LVLALGLGARHLLLRLLTACLAASQQQHLQLLRLLQLLLQHLQSVLLILTRLLGMVVMVAWVLVEIRWGLLLEQVLVQLVLPHALPVGTEQGLGFRITAVCRASPRLLMLQEQQLVRLVVTAPLGLMHLVPGMVLMP